MPPGSIGPEWIVVAAEVDANSDIVRAVIVWVCVEVQVRLSLCHNGFADTILHKVVIEIRTRCEAENQICNLRLRVIGHVPHVAQSVIPMIASNVFLEDEGVTRERGEDCTYAFRRIHTERFSVAPTSNLEFFSASDEVIVYRIERK